MGILGSLLKMGIEAGLAAIPGAGPYLAPLAGAALNPQPGQGILGTVANAGMNYGSSQLTQGISDLFKSTPDPGASQFAGNPNYSVDPQAMQSLNPSSGSSYLSVDPQVMQGLNPNNPLDALALKEVLRRSSMLAGGGYNLGGQ